MTIRRLAVAVLSPAMQRAAKVFLAIFFLASAFPGAAQITTASLGGTVHDASGAVIPNIQVQVLNIETNVATPVSTNANGQFLAPSLPPGRYEVIVQAQGFKRLDRQGIVLDVDQALELDLTMELGDTRETVEVSARGTLLDTASSEMGQLVNQKAVANLPLNGRDPWALILLAPSATGKFADNYNGNSYSINGGRSLSGSLLVDGVPSAATAFNQNNIFTVFPSVDLVQEFKVETGSYSAEFGRSGTGIVNLIYKTGTNDPHGSAYDFLRNSDLDSNTFFANKAGVALPSFRRNQFGATLGGPVYIPKFYNGRNKTFFLFGYEGLKQSTGTNLTTSVPTALQRTGDFSQTRSAAGAMVVIYDPLTTVASGSGFVRAPFTGNIIPASRFDPVATNVVKYYPMPNQPGNPNTSLSNYFVSTVTPVDTHSVDTKIDENVNERNRFFVRVSRRSQTNIPPNEVPADISIAQGGVTLVNTWTNVAADYTFVKSSSFIVDLRLGYGRVVDRSSAVSLGFDPTSLGFPKYMAEGQGHLFPQFNVTNLFSLGDGGGGAYGLIAVNTQSIGIRAMKISGNHLIKFGFETYIPQVNSEQGNLSPSGTFTFTPSYTQGPNPNQASATAGNAFASFLLGTGTGSLGNSAFTSTTSKYYAWYLADDWKLTPKLTLNLGLRYGLDMPYTERYNRANVFDPTILSPLAATTGLAGLTGGLRFLGTDGLSRLDAPIDPNGWDPRFGFAYHALKNTVLRGGVGIFHAPSFREAQGATSATGYAATTSFVSAANGVQPTVFLSNPFPGGLVPITGNSDGLLTGVGTAVIAATTSDYRVPYTESWNFNIQQQLPKEIQVEVAYVGNHSLFLPFNSTGTGAWNLDQLRPEQLSSALQQQVANPFFGQIKSGPLAAATVPRSYLVAPFPQYLSLMVYQPLGAISSYNSMQVKVERRFGSGDFLLTYNTQKLIDNNSGTSTARNQNIYNVAADKAVSRMDVSQRLVFSYVYELPFGKGKRFGNSWGRVADSALGGWQVNGIATFEAGVPLAVTTQNTSGSGSVELRPNNNGQSAQLSGSIISRLNEYFNTSVFSQPAPFTFGNTGRTLPDVRAPGVKNFDCSIFKNFHPLEKLTLQFRGEAFNAFNRVQFGEPNQVLSSGQFGVITTQANTPRQIQFALKLLF